MTVDQVLAEVVQDSTFYHGLAAASPCQAANACCKPTSARRGKGPPAVEPAHRLLMAVGCGSLLDLGVQVTVPTVAAIAASTTRMAGTRYAWQVSEPKSTITAKCSEQD
jgi:hypothetical protein